LHRRTPPSSPLTTPRLLTTPVRRSSFATGAVVLLVQPERDDREMYAEYLSHMGLTPLCVQEAHAALRLASRADVIVTGLLLPGPIDGYALIDRLRNGIGTRNIPIVVLTGCAWTAEEARARSAGCDVFLSKPCFPDMLLREIQRMLTARTPRRRIHG
jgi:two-component system cell cycle response regulator DivK